MTEPSPVDPRDSAPPARVTLAPGDHTGRRFQEAEGLRPMVLFLWAALLGSLVGLVGAVFHLTLDAATAWRDEFAASFDSGRVLWWLLPATYSAVAVSLALLLVRRVAPETSGSGVQEIEGALDDLRPLRWRRVLPVKFFGGACALGGGLVLGREGPTIQIGGNLGRMLGDLFKLTSVDVHTLVAAGAGAGLSAAFNAPLAGILFVVEEMRPQFKYNFLSVHSVLIATVMSDIVVRVIMGQGHDIPMELLGAPPLESLWLFPLLGVMFGVLGVGFNRLLIAMLDFFASLKGWHYALAGVFVGGAIGLIGAFYPDFIGGGYRIIPRALQETIPSLALLIIFIARFATTTVSYGCGAPGGIFTPMLALATLFGMWSGHFAHAWFPTLVEHPQVFAVAGMGALFAATVRAPLTGIALSIELTGSYALILPLILTCMVAAIVSQALGGRPIYTVLLERTLERANRTQTV